MCAVGDDFWRVDTGMLEPLFTPPDLSGGDADSAEPCELVEMLDLGEQAPTLGSIMSNAPAGEFWA